MRAIEKARAFSSSVRGRGAVRTPRIFSPPSYGSSYFGRSYRWEQVLHYKYWTFVAIRAWIHEIAGGAPLNLGRIKKRVPGGTKAIRKALGGPRDHEDFEPYDDDHPLQRVFMNPNGPDVAYDLWAYTVLFKKLTGSAHWWVIRNQFNVPVEIWVIPTQWMQMLVDDDGHPKAYMVMSPWGRMADVPYDDVVSFYEHSPLNRYEGYGVSQAISEWLDVYESMTRTRLATFKNGAVPTIHVALGEEYGDPDERMLNRFYAKWFARFQGEDRAGLPLMTGPGVEVKTIGAEPDKIKFVEGEDQLRDMILAAYGVPKGVVGIEPTSDVSAYAPQRQFCRFAINPELHYMGQVIREKIVKTVDEEGTAYWDDRVVDDPEQVSREIQQDVTLGVRTPNEARALRGLEPYEFGGDDPIVNGTLMPWGTGKSADRELDEAFERSLGSSSGTTGGYLTNGRGHEWNRS